MNPAGWWYAGYLCWLLAGLADFACHRRTGIAYTSGLPESLLHMLQIALLGTAILVWLLCEPSAATVAVIGGLTVLHAAAGYLDTRTAYRTRDITPFEQHLHSVLDMAPWIGMAVVVFPLRSSATAGWEIDLRRIPFPAATWMAVLLPAIACCVLPLAMELFRVLRARRGNLIARPSGQGTP